MLVNQQERAAANNQRFIQTKMYPNLFKGLEKMDPEHHIKLKENISPIVHLSRKIPASVRVKINWEELNNMEKTCVIRKTDKTLERG